MLEILRFIFSSFWVFIGTLALIFTIISTSGWAINAILIGWRGQKCDDVGLVKIG